MTILEYLPNKDRNLKIRSNLSFGFSNFILNILLGEVQNVCNRKPLEKCKLKLRCSEIVLINLFSMPKLIQLPYASSEAH